MYQLIRDNIDPKKKEEESAFTRGGIRRKRIKNVPTYSCSNNPKKSSQKRTNKSKRD